MNGYGLRFLFASGTLAVSLLVHGCAMLWCGIELEHYVTICDEAGMPVYNVNVRCFTKERSENQWILRDKCLTSEPRDKVGSNVVDPERSMVEFSSNVPVYVYAEDIDSDGMWRLGVEITRNSDRWHDWYDHVVVMKRVGRLSRDEIATIRGDLEWLGEKDRLRRLNIAVEALNLNCSAENSSAFPSR